MERPGHALANFDPVRCAALHNELVARRIAINANILQYFVRNVFKIPGIPETHPDDPDTAIRDFLSEDLITFLESIDSLVPQHPYQLGLTPFVMTPDVTTFWLFSDYDPQDEYPYAILLYQDLQSSTRGGLFFDQNTNLACWVTLPGRWPAAEDWIPLEQILQRWLYMWESGKIQAISSGDHELVLRPWSESDPEQTMRSWERLLQAVESRLPNHRVPPQSHLVSREVVDRYPCHSFARAFLSTARAPRVPQLRVAPGIATFTDEAYEEMYSSEAPDSKRIQTIRQRGLQEEDLIPSILFPATGNVPEPPVQGLDNMGRFGVFLLERQAGIYLKPDVSWGDSVTLVDTNGRQDAFLYAPGRGPWIPRETRLLEIFTECAKRVERGEWVVGELGVEGTSPDLSHIRLSWGDI